MCNNQKLKCIMPTGATWRLVPTNWIARAPSGSVSTHALPRNPFLAYVSQTWLLLLATKAPKQYASNVHFETMLSEQLAK